MGTGSVHVSVIVLCDVLNCLHNKQYDGCIFLHVGVDARVDYPNASYTTIPSSPHSSGVTLTTSMTNKVLRGNMKVSGRVCEIHCLFLLVVAILIAVQLFLQNAQKHLSEASESKTLDESEVHLEKRDISYSENKEFIEADTPFAAPV